jgi:hypothetical protein
MGQDLEVVEHLVEMYADGGAPKSQDAKASISNAPPSEDSTGHEAAPSQVRYNLASGN